MHGHIGRMLMRAAVDGQRAVPKEHDYWYAVAVADILALLLTNDPNYDGTHAFNV